MNARELRGLTIATTMKLSQRGHCFVVPSQTGIGRYTVFPLRKKPFCSCPDHEATGENCKHIFACLYVLDRKKNKDGSETVTESLTIVKQTYSQDWPSYNCAQVNEKAKFVVLLHDLCANIADTRPDAPKTGRPPIPLADVLFSVIYKVYSGLSARRFSTDLREAHEQGKLSTLPHYNSVINYLEDEDLTPILGDLITRSALPLKAIELDFAVDSTGFTLNRTFAWYDEKYDNYRPTKDWLKVHVLSGVKTNAVFAVEITDRDANDSPFFKPLVERTAKNFTMREVSGDAAYASQENFGAVDKAGGTGYLFFKENATGGIGGLFEKMFHFFSLNKETYLKHYHKRSNAESTFSAIKRKLGDLIRSKGEVAVRNEMLAKLVA